ncbi:MAG: hypothetical protein EKK63_15825 [Acinetobacter sp.]|uniref:YopX family protein n=1 Tax=Acinetobacter sp. TaxID=472 RepID=UPI000FBE3234|nr:YopX family protein [Acinetobacter sp.]RUP37037.1 MAG: hypothetical protein EKK63_15825 [Acinetobacter sp.]
MNREIIFRGLTKQGEWIFGDLCRSDNKVYVFPFLENGQLYSPDDYEVIPETVGQFTGLRDKNGKEIYEDDVVKILYTDWISKPENDPRNIDEYLNDIAVKGIVKFKDCKFGIVICSEILDSIFCGKYGFIEVIGNIHENK